ncbi:MAG: phosphodiester glycosidase family protein [Ichthyobacteriaceae bacterium]|nr:phosphodiester glycosidase family protein [Ichthyobacteriaceae bacterium]
MMKKLIPIILTLYFSVTNLYAIDSLQIEKITIYRLAPDEFDIGLYSNKNTTADDWAKIYDLDIVINAGMFSPEGKHIGYMTGQTKHINKYQSFMFFGAKKEGIPEIRVGDKDKHNIKSLLKEYSLAIQNLRMIKSGAENRWSKQYKKWSEVALGIDKYGNLLIAFSRHPYTMFEFNNILINSDLEIDALQHLEGGPEASLYYKGHYKYMGSYETDFNENDDNLEFWDIPNIIGIKLIK